MSKFRSSLNLCVIAVLAASLIRPQASAAQAASPQVSDPRAACAADIQKLCPNVPAGGGRILACLVQHKTEVSAGCKQAVLGAMKSSGGASPGASPAPAAAGPAPATASPATPAAPGNVAGSASAAPSKTPTKQRTSSSSTSAVSGEHSFLMKQVKIVDQ